MKYSTNYSTMSMKLLEHTVKHLHQLDREDLCALIIELWKRYKHVRS